MKISVLLSAETEAHVKAVLAGKAREEISDHLRAVDPLSPDDLASLGVPVLVERLTLLSDISLRLGLLEISDRLLSLGELLTENRKLRGKRDLVDFLRHGKFPHEISDHNKSVDQTVTALRRLGGEEISDHLKQACIVHRLKKLASVYRSIKISDAISRIQVHSVQEISEAALWSRRTPGVPRVDAEISGDWLRLLSH